MSDPEEPPSKVAKMEMSAEFLDESLDQGHEEWLTEDALTDEDHILQNPSSDSISTINHTIEKVSKTIEPQTSKSDYDLENTLNNLDSTNDKKDQESPKEEEKKPDEENESNALSSGNDTDGLLRMLQDDNKIKQMKRSKVRSKNKNNTSQEESSDDEYVFEKSNVTKKVTSTKIRTYPPATARKAIPEDSDSDESTDEAKTMRNMFKNRNVAAKSTAKPFITEQQKMAIQKYIERRDKMNKAAQKMNAQRLLKASNKINTSKKASPTVIKPSPTVIKPSPTVMKPSPTVIKPSPTVTKPSPIHIKSSPIHMKTSPSHTQKPISKTTVASNFKSNKPKVNPLDGARRGPMSKEVTEEKELVENDLNDDLASNPDETSNMKMDNDQNIQEPERMDEEVPSDEDSEDGSYYEDEMPTSDSDDLEDWFTLDLRAERAGEYIPMLGEKAHKILTEEKERVSSRLNELRKSVIALSDSAKQQAEQIREATNTLNELEALIKAT